MLPRPLITDRHRAVFENARLEPFPDQADDALVADPMLDEPDEPILAHRIEERPDVGVHDPVHPPAGDPHRQGVERIVRSAPGPKPVAEPEEVLLVRIAFSTMTTALWTILSSSAATASGLCRPSAFGMYVRRDGSGR